MPETARLGEHLAIVGPGLDEVLEPGRRIVLLDDFYGDLYGDYVFLGYDVYAETVLVERGDLVGAYTVARLLDAGPSVIVCGEDPRACIAGYAAYRVLHGADPLGAAREAARALAGLYPVERLRLPRPIASSLEALSVLVEAYTAKGVSALFALGENYGYGIGPGARLRYGERVTWARSLRLPRETLLAASLMFLVEGPGREDVVLRDRVSALGGREALREALGEEAGRALEALEAWARGGAEAEPGLGLLEALGPGGEAPVYVEAVEGRLLLYCPGGEEELKQCAEKAGRAEGLAARLSLGSPRIRREPPGELVLFEEPG